MNRDEVEREVGQRIRAAREARGWSQAQLASALTEIGLPLKTGTVSRLEAGGLRPTLVAEVYGVAEVIGVPVATLLPDVRTSGEEGTDVVERNWLLQRKAVGAMLDRVKGEVAKLDGFIEAQREGFRPWVAVGTADGMTHRSPVEFTTMPPASAEDVERWDREADQEADGG